MTSDPVLQRITAPAPAGASVGTIQFPTDLTPNPAQPPAEISDALPKADVCVLAYTVAEKQALADVLTPGVHHTSWSKYTHGWSTFEKHLTGRSPAREEGCAAIVCQTQVGGTSVLCVGVNLHLSTDDKTIPVMALIKQIAAETGCKLMITHGTAGGVGEDTQLGDVVLTGTVKFNLAKSQWENEPYAQQRFVSSYPLAGVLDAGTPNLVAAFETLIPAVIGDHLKDTTPAQYAPTRNPTLFTPGNSSKSEIETVAVFAFADTDDTYGVVANDPNARVEEMDDACVALALEGTGTAWLACRNASDPQMGSGPIAELKKVAAKVYQAKGYYTTICSALACWGLIADTPLKGSFKTGGIVPASGASQVVLHPGEEILPAYTLTVGPEEEHMFQTMDDRITGLASGGTVEGTWAVNPDADPEERFEASVTVFGHGHPKTPGSVVGTGTGRGRSLPAAVIAAVDAYQPS